MIMHALNEHLVILWFILKYIEMDIFTEYPIQLQFITMTS